MMKFGQKSLSWRETGREDDDDEEEKNFAASFFTNQKKRKKVSWAKRKKFPARFDESEIISSFLMAMIM